VIFDDSEPTMLRWMTPLLVAACAVGTAAAADEPVPPKPPEPVQPAKPTKPVTAASRAASKLPPGLPRAHYKYRTTVAPATAPYVRRVRVVDEPELLFTPSSGYIPYIPPLVGTPLLPGSSALPGYYGRAFSYDYQGPYYGGPYVSYWNRLPYACGVYGYC
jgi:hypothetical protein